MMMLELATGNNLINKPTMEKFDNNNNNIDLKKTDHNNEPVTEKQCLQQNRRGKRTAITSIR